MINTTAIVVIIVLGSLIVIGVSLFMLNRSWGDFPRQAVMPSHSDASNQGGSNPPIGSSTSFDDEAMSDDEATVVRVGATGEENSRILITHPTLLRAAESALYQNSSHARYLVREGDQLFFAFDRIADPQQRQQAVDLMRRFQAGQHVDMGSVFRLLALLDKG